MATIDSRTILNPGKTALPLWPAARKRLTIIFDTGTGNGELTVLVVDPDTRKQLFEGAILLAQKQAFADAMANGDQNVLVTDLASNDNAKINPHTVVIPGTGSGDGTGNGPKIQVGIRIQFVPVALASTGG